MSDKFTDSNILLYLFSKDSNKKETALKIFNEHPVISMQVIGENMNVCLRKFNFTAEKAMMHFQQLQKNCDIRAITTTTIEVALLLLKRYKYSFWDSLIIASAIESNCSILYSEDMQHNQVIEGKLTIVNPFV